MDGLRDGSTTDVAAIGAGSVGLAVAYALARDRSRVGRGVPDGVDLLSGRAPVPAERPSLAGDISGQQLGHFMLERLRAEG